MATSHRRPLILHPGAELGGFTIEEVMGVGGMAVVYRARQRSLGRSVALKVLDPRLSEDEAFRERFRREGEHVAALDHPHIVPVHDSGEVDGRLYLAMRLVDGDTLAERMRRPGLSAEETAQVVTQIAGALDAAHAAGVLHRDVKPQNILLAGDHAYLADFGVAKGADAATQTGSGGFLGSVHYASPEQIRGDALGPATDLYSLAAAAYECFTGRAPFNQPSEAGVIHAHLDEPPPPLPGKLGAGARELSRVLTRGLSKRPDDRHASASAFAADLARAVARLGGAERSRRPAFLAPGAGVRGAAAAGAGAAAAPLPTPSSAETAPVASAGALVDASLAQLGAARTGRPGGAETIDLGRAGRAGANGAQPGATIIDRRSRLVPHADGAPQRSRWDRVRRPLGGVAVLAVAGVAVAVALGAFGGGDDTVALAAAGTTLSVPGDWTASGKPNAARFGGLDVRVADGAEATNGTGDWIAVGPMNAGGTLRPSKARGSASRVSAGDAQGFAWDTSDATGARERVAVLPADGGTVAVACGTKASGDANTACDAAIRSIDGLRDPLTAKAERTETTAITAALTRLRTARAAQLPRAAAGRPAVADRLGRAHASAAQALERLGPQTRWDVDRAALAQQLRGVSHEYARLATAARKHDRAADARARDHLARDDARVRRAIAEIQGRRPAGADGQPATLPALRTLALTTLQLPKKKKAVKKNAAAVSVASTPAAATTTVAPSTTRSAPSSSSAPKTSSKPKSSSKPKKSDPVVVAPPSATE